MCKRSRRFELPHVPLRCACLELLHEVIPLKVDLPLRHVDPTGRGVLCNLGGVELVSPPHRFCVHGPKILGNEGDRRGLRPEPTELGMVPVALRLSRQHRLGEKSLAPQRDQPSGIKVFGMQAPEAHTGIVAAAGHGSRCAMRRTRPQVWLETNFHPASRHFPGLLQGPRTRHSKGRTILTGAASARKPGIDRTAARRTAAGEARECLLRAAAFRMILTTEFHCPQTGRGTMIRGASGRR